MYSIQYLITVSVKLVLIYQKQGLRAETEVCVKKDTIYHTIEVEWDVKYSPHLQFPFVVGSHKATLEFIVMPCAMGSNNVDRPE